MIKHFQFRILIHTPAWGATLSGCCHVQFLYNFNPRSREGSDGVSDLIKPSFPISIHAPAWGATGTTTGSSRWSPYFNPRSRVGSDLSISYLGTNSPGFQSTLPRGERRIIDSVMTLVYSFQSALPRGERPCNTIKMFYQDIFQSALPRGERHTRGVKRGQKITISIRAPARGATSCRRRPQSSIRYFNPRSREGSDRNAVYKWVTSIAFQSALPRGERQHGKVFRQL